MNARMLDLSAHVFAKLRRSGFTRPLHPHQVCSWAAYCVQLILYFAVLFPTFTPAGRLAVSVPYVAAFCLFNAFFVLAERETHPCPYVTADSDAPHEYCQWCSHSVRLECKHCRCCDACRHRFDHHCFFLNNCITDANYRWFALGIACLTVSAIFTTLLCIWVIMATEYQDGEPLRRAAQLYGRSVPKAVVYGGAAWLLLQELAIEVFMIYLSALHILLARRGIRTFELITYRRQIRMERDAMGDP
jgi:hypothetical protein